MVKSTRRTGIERVTDANEEQRTRPGGDSKKTEKKTMKQKEDITWESDSQRRTMRISKKRVRGESEMRVWGNEKDSV